MGRKRHRAQHTGQHSPELHRFFANWTSTDYAQRKYQFVGIGGLDPHARTSYRSFARGLWSCAGVLLLIPLFEAWMGRSGSLLSVSATIFSAVVAVCGILAWRSRFD